MFPTAMVPEELLEEITTLEQGGCRVEIVEQDKKIYIIFKDYCLPKNLYNISSTDLLIFTTPNYPDAGFDMFWVDETLLLKNDSIPKAGDEMESHLGKTWRRFSYHPYDKKHWNPSEDDVISFFGYVEQRLNRGD